MSTPIDTRERSQRTLRLALAIAVAIAVAVVAVGARLAWSGSGEAGEAPAGGSAYGYPAGVTAEVTARLVAELEKATPSDHAAHGHDFNATAEAGGGTKVICTVEPFGYDPADPADIKQVGRVYAHHLCAVVQKGRPWDFAVKTAGPLVADMGDPPQIRVVESGLGYQERLAQMIPERYRARAAEDFGDGSLVAALRARYDRESAP